MELKTALNYLAIALFAAWIIYTFWISGMLLVGAVAAFAASEYLDGRIDVKKFDASEK